MVLEFVPIALGEGAVCGCPSCAPSSTVAYDSLETVRTAINAAAERCDDPTGLNLLLTGPEPFEHPQLPALVATCVEAGAARIALETDGAALSAGPNAAGVLRAGVHHLRVRTVDLTAEAQRTDDMIAGVSAYRSAASSAAVKVVVTAVVPVCRHNLSSLASTVSEAAAIGFDAVRLVTGGELPASAGASIASACDTGMVNRLWVETDGSLPLLVSHRAHAVSGGGIVG